MWTRPLFCGHEILPVFSVFIGVGVVWLIIIIKYNAWLVVINIIYINCNGVREGMKENESWGRSSKGMESFTSCINVI